MILSTFTVSWYSIVEYFLFPLKEKAGIFMA